MRISMMKRMISGLTLLGILLGVAGQATAAIVGVTGGTAAPGATLGPYSMTPFGPDPQALFATVTSVASPLGGSVGFGIPLEHLMVGNGWATWSNGYTGDVYWNQGGGDITLTMPSGTGAFYLYAEPDAFGVETVTATAQDGTAVTQSVDGNGGASYFGFYGTAGDQIVSITVSDPSNDFAIGQFGISGSVIPEPSSVVLLGVGAVGLLGCAWRRRKRVS
jgi:hypothetical protein